MLASSEPATFAALILLILLILTALRLRTVRRQRRSARIQLATVTGHPSMLGQRAAWGDRRALAMTLAHQLAAAGLVTERRNHQPIVRAQGLAGEYVLTVLYDQILVEYVTKMDRLQLPDCRTIDEAVQLVTEHTGLRAPA